MYLLTIISTDKQKIELTLTDLNKVFEVVTCLQSTGDILAYYIVTEEYLAAIGDLKCNTKRILK
jgi:hypothetical protein